MKQAQQIIDTTETALDFSPCYKPFFIKAKLCPPKTSIKKVWAGIYGGHYDCIVFFKKKPKLSKEAYGYEWFDEKYIDMVENKDLTCGAMWYADFETLYPEAAIQIRPIFENRRIEIVEVFQIGLEAVWDKYNELERFEFRADGY